MGAAPVPKFVPFVRNFSWEILVGKKEKKNAHNTVYFHAVAYPSRWPPKP